MADTAASGATPTSRTSWSPIAPQASITAMMERLSAGLERRATVPPRDPTPALRDALAELNRLAERRD